MEYNDRWDKDMWDWGETEWEEDAMEFFRGQGIVPTDFMLFGLVNKLKNRYTLGFQDGIEEGYKDMTQIFGDE